jgi:hypothetical protein
MTGHNWLVRASQVGALMTRGRGKEEWGATAMQAIKDAVLFNEFGIDKFVTSKHIEKGIINEAASLEMVKRVTGWEMDLDKPKKRLVNSWVIGEPDVLDNGYLIDVKNSWDGTTFPWFETEVPNKTYEYQLQTYMWLSGYTHSFLIYTLTSAPEHMVYKEAEKIAYNLHPLPKYIGKSLDEMLEIGEKLARQQLVFDDIPESKRIKTFRIERNETIIEEVKKRVEDARGLYDAFRKQLKNQI